MSKFKSMLFSLIATAIVMSFSSSIANAQSNPSDYETNQWRQVGPCSDPWISKAVYEFKQRAAAGVGDFGECSPALYANGHWNNYAELLKGVMRSLGAFNSNRVTFAKDAPVNGAVIIKTLSDGVVIGSGTVKILTNNGGTLITSDGAGIISHDGGTFIFGQYNLSAIDPVSIVKKFPIDGGKYFIVRRPAGGSSSGRSDDQILLCINSSNSVLAQIRRADGGANHISLTVSGGTAYFSGNVLTQAYKNQLTSAAQSCGARAVNTNNLRVGR